MAKAFAIGRAEFLHSKPPVRASKRRFEHSANNAEARKMVYRGALYNSWNNAKFGALFLIGPMFK